MRIFTQKQRKLHTEIDTHTLTLTHSSHLPPLSHLQDVGDDSYAPVGETEREEREPDSLRKRKRE